MDELEASFHTRRVLLMELTFQAATPAERVCSASQSMQFKGRTGCASHLRAGTGMDAQGRDAAAVNELLIKLMA